jgi:hypothetical protein
MLAKEPLLQNIKKNMMHHRKEKMCIYEKKSEPKFVDYVEQKNSSQRNE